ncbi:MAG: hypothetical protein KC619_22515 [Myxococcales bacterium]|nr:hypothetical protein [Myxococcales bacterium]
MTAVAQLEGSVRPRSAPRFVHGGIAFDFLCGPGVDFHVTAEHERFSAPFSAGPVAASIRVAVAALRYDVPTGREIDGRWADGLATLRSRGVRAEMREIGRGRFVASALVEPGPIGCTALATALAGAALERVGGLILHASAVEVDDGAVLFVGPSTAGKTTAANLCRGARAFAKDRAAIYPTANGWYAAPMWGGASEIELPWSARRVLPLHAILRIAKDDTPAVHDAGPARAVGILRESAQVIRHGALEEGALLEQLVRMSSEVRVGVARTVLGQPMLPVLREWLEAGG